MAQGPAALPKRPITPALQCGDESLKQIQAGDLSRAIVLAVQALPQSRSSEQDIEAATLYAISQRSLCPGVARMALASLTSGSPQFLRAVAYVRNSLINNAAGTAGIVTSNGSGSFTQFSAPIVGLGGGSATYSN